MATSVDIHPGELQGMIREVRVLWEGLDRHERQELAAMLLKEHARRKKTG